LGKTPFLKKLDSDPLGHLSITSEGITKRDEMVFKECFKLKIPICMVLSGGIFIILLIFYLGYAKTNAQVITDSIENLISKLDIFNISKNHYNNFFNDKKEDEIDE
jgi:histone deacetylase 11